MTLCNGVCSASVVTFEVRSYKQLILMLVLLVFCGQNRYFPSIEQSTGESAEEAGAYVDVYEYMLKMTLDVLGQGASQPSLVS